VEQTWREYYWDCLKHFGSDGYKGAIVGLVSTILGAGVSYFIKFSRDPAAGDAFQDSVLVGLVILWVFTLFYAVRTPWKAQRHLSLLDGNPKASFGFVGTAMAFYLFFGVGYLAYEKWGPKEHRAAISAQSPDYPSVVNTLNTFFNVQNASPKKKCLVRLTAPPENRELLFVLKSMAKYFCEIQPEQDPAMASEDILKDSVDDFIVVHMAKEITTTDPSPRESIVMNELGNVFAVRRTYQMPQGAAPGLIWLQIGRGFPYKRKD